MLFITNRTPKQSARSRKGRNINFDYNNTAVSQFLYFCERTGDGKYTEIMSPAFFQRLKDLPKQTQLLFYIHGFNNNMEPEIFNSARKLERLINQQSKNLVCVIPIIWPCDDDNPLAFIDDYWDDQDAADASGPAFSRLIGKFDDWRHDKPQLELPCLRRINIVAHSMGNRVLQNALHDWAIKYSSGNMPMLFRNTFMIAADIENQALEKHQNGRYIVDASRNVVVYYASDDLAMPASKLANLRNKTLSRRMGMTGPEDMLQLPKSVYEVDCDEFNQQFDVKGHHYFLDNTAGDVSPIIAHMVQAISSGRVQPAQRSYILKK
ncbi:alpha/beta hydrolase [Thalassotalea maritima]|uniref:alpha/beta hydrolase n=1 Tax=Thalassotalea maritima TaxID=3242416 RepID=UPI003528BD48